MFKAISYIKNKYTLIACLFGFSVYTIIELSNKNEGYFWLSWALLSVSVLISLLLLLKKDKKQKVKLLNSSLFTDLNYYINIGINEIDIKDDNKETLIKFILFKIYEATYNNLKKQFEENEIPTFDLDNEIRIAKKIKQDYIYELEKNKIPEWIVKLIEEKSNNIENVFFFMMQYYRDHEFYKTDYQKQIAKLNSYKANIKYQFNNIKECATEINGNLEKFLHKNKDIINFWKI